VGRVGGMAEGEKPCTLLTGKPEAKRPLGRPRRRWKCDVKLDCKKKKSGPNFCGPGYGEVASCYK